MWRRKPARLLGSIEEGLLLLLSGKRSYPNISIMIVRQPKTTSVCHLLERLLLLPSIVRNLINVCILCPSRKISLSRTWQCLRSRVPAHAVR